MLAGGGEETPRQTSFLPSPMLLKPMKRSAGQIVKCMVQSAKYACATVLKGVGRGRHELVLVPRLWLSKDRANQERRFRPPRSLGGVLMML